LKFLFKHKNTKSKKTKQIKNLLDIITTKIVIKSIDFQNRCEKALDRKKPKRASAK